MSYVSLARKYRPRRFVDMVGQETTTLALTNAIRLRREPHSVIFTGVRGIGKTTSARIYAKALNCEQGPTAEPCDVCASCQAITVGNHEDVLEIDGASNTGVDDVRALQETLSYVPQRSTYKIYIIDEVHMLSISAFNALLKTLEEPPQHVVFIFATTELHKVPETIQSRCQTFHLQKISRPVIAERVKAILEAEQIPFDEAALTVVAREGRGSMRDALTMLDQAIAVGGGQVTVETLRSMVGSSQSLPVLELLDGLLRKDASQILDVIARWDQEGQAMSTLAEETAKACRNAFILKDLKGQSIDAQILELEDREQAMLTELGEKAAPMDLNRLFRLLAKCLDDLRHADLDRFVLENYCLEWCFDPGLPDLQTMMNIISGGQPFVAAAAARPALQAQQGEAPGVNLRERLKTTVPPPAVKPATSVQAAAPRPTTPPPAPQARPAATPTTAAPAFGSPLNPAVETTAAAPKANPTNLGARLASAVAPQAPRVDVSSQPASTAPIPQPTSRTSGVQGMASPPQAYRVDVSSQPSPPAGNVSPQPAPMPSPPAGNVSSQPGAAAQAPRVDVSSQPAPISQAAAPQKNRVEASPQQPIPPAPPATRAEATAQVRMPPSPPAWEALRNAAPSAHSSQGNVVAERAGAVVKQKTESMPPWMDEEPPMMDPPAWMPEESAPAAESKPEVESFLQKMQKKAASVTASSAPVAAPEPAPLPAAAPGSPVFPDTWRAFVDEWKKQKPLQARYLEEAYLLEYGPQRIRLAVEPSSMAGGKLLQQDVRKRLLEQFVQLFGFKGQLEAVPKADAGPTKTGSEAQPGALGETLLEVKNRERELARENLRHRLEEHPMTREVISRFGGTIEQIELQ